MKHPLRVTTCVSGLAVALLMCGGCGQDSPGSGQENEQPPAAPGDGLADQKSGENADTHLPSDRILEMLGVDLARINLAEPSAISIFAEFGEASAPGGESLGDAPDCRAGRLRSRSHPDRRRERRGNCHHGNTQGEPVSQDRVGVLSDPVGRRRGEIHDHGVVASRRDS